MKKKAIYTPEELDRLTKMNKRLMFLFIGIDIFVVGYIVYQIFSIFSK